jgi:hypothetical protein
MKLKKEVFLTPEFTDYARKNLGAGGDRSTSLEAP